MEVKTGQRRNLSELAELMNKCCTSKRGFSRVTEGQLKEIWNRSNVQDVPGLVMVRHGGEVVGAVHGLYEPHDRTGYIAFILSLPGLEERVWPLLLSAVETNLNKAQVIRFGSPHTPLYQAAEGRFKPLWGSTEVLEVNSTDTKMLKFLELNGYVRQHEYVTMAKDLESLPVLNGIASLGKSERLQGDDCWYNAYSWYGKSSAEEFGLRRKELRAVVLRQDHEVLGHVAWYPLEQGVAAICDLEVTRAFRGQGLGKYLLHLALIDIREAGFESVELHTSRLLSPVGYALYQTTGFSVVATWVELAKRLRAKA